VLLVLNAVYFCHYCSCVLLHFTENSFGGNKRKERKMCDVDVMGL